LKKNPEHTVNLVSRNYKLLSVTQSSFRKQQQTVDHLTWLESYIRDAFVQKQHVIAILFDLDQEAQLLLGVVDRTAP